MLRIWISDTVQNQPLNVSGTNDDCKSGMRVVKMTLYGQQMEENDGQIIEWKRLVSFPSATMANQQP